MALSEPVVGLKDIDPPPHCIADFCLVPIGTSSASVSAEIADVQRLLKESGLKYEMRSAGTTVEGDWGDVMSFIGKAHSYLHQRNGVMRVQTDIRVGTRIDKKQSFEDKVKAVEERLGADSSKSAK